MGLFTRCVKTSGSYLSLAGGRASCIQEATLGERLRVREDRSRPRSHCPRQPGAPVSIAMVPCCGKRWAVPGLRRNPGLVFPVLELPGPDSPATALRGLTECPPAGRPQWASPTPSPQLCCPQEILSAKFFFDGRKATRAAGNPALRRSSLDLALPGPPWPRPPRLAYLLQGISAFLSSSTRTRWLSPS